MPLDLWRHGDILSANSERPTSSWMCDMLPRVCAYGQIFVMARMEKHESDIPHIFFRTQTGFYQADLVFFPAKVS